MSLFIVKVMPVLSVIQLTYQFINVAGTQSSNKHRCNLCTSKKLLEPFNSFETDMKEVFFLSICLFVCGGGRKESGQSD